MDEVIFENTGFKLTSKTPPKKPNFFEGVSIFQFCIINHL